MSNSAAYQWTYVDVEAERRRELRAQLAQEITRSRNLRGQAKSLRRAYGTARVDVHVVSVPGSADSADLAAALDSAQAVNERAEAELGRAAADIWSLPPAKDKKRTESDTRPAPEPAARPRADRTEQVRAASLVEAEALLTRDGPSCEPDDLPLFARRLDALRRARSTEEARTLLHDLGVLVHKSTQRQRDAVRTAALRARLLDRLEDAEPADREQLAEAVREAPDPSHLADEVDLAVAHADTARHRSTVADTLMQVLRERDYAVGDDFADLLEEDGSVVVPFGEAVGYGLRVALAPDRPDLTTVLVAEAEADPETDHEVQRWFCDEQLPAIEEAVRAHGVDLARKSTLPPGVRPTAVVPDGSWPDTGLAHDRTDEDADQSEQAERGERPQRRRKKKTGPARSTTYGQEGQRER
ncbi:hypothetical protein OG588_40635 [Streptomyces prunicolor]|uniref:hypothetical protein n=1 Tax=Streptomyces prunicolor TaxID=67348 RepID=UPI003866AB61|nr:hypothetical protein OG588_40635 [Streptomyces prunicolor]